MAGYHPLWESGSSLDRTNDDGFGDDVPLHRRKLGESHNVWVDDNDDNLDTAHDVEAEKQLPQIVPKWKQYKTFSSLTKSSCIAVLPRFCRPQALKVRGKPHPTSYLEALRGYAAFTVYVCHMVTFNAYNPSYRRQPFLLILFAGPGMVALFYVISGCALSYSLLKNIRRQESASTFEGLVSSTFRRYYRLYGSTVLAIFISLVMVRVG